MRGRGGTRLGEVAVESAGGRLTVPLAVAGKQGAQMLYEVVFAQ